MEEEKPPSSPSKEASINEALQRRIRAYQRAEGIGLLVCFSIAILFLVIAGLLLLTHFTIVRLAEGYHPQIVLTVWLIPALGVLTSYSALLIRRFYNRHTEYQADEVALQITSDVSAFKSAKIRMMNLGKSPLDVSPLHLLERTHPSVRQRLAHADEFASRMKVASLDGTP